MLIKIILIFEGGKNKKGRDSKDNYYSYKKSAPEFVTAPYTWIALDQLVQEICIAHTFLYINISCYTLE